MNDIANSQDFDLFDDLVISFNVDEELSLKFFLIFAWFENILKYLNYYDRRKNYVSIDWVKFGDDLDGNFESDKSPELRAAVDYLVQQAPRNQRVVDGGIEWQGVEPSGGTEFGKILSRVTTVRNNFFHGGKFPRLRERDAQLLRACLIILKECVELHPELKNYYRWQLKGVEG